MRFAKLAVAGGMAGFVLAGFAMAESASLGPHQPTSVEQTAFGYDDYYYLVQDEGPPSPSPSDAPAPVQEDEMAPLADCAGGGGCDQACGGGCGSCCASNACSCVSGWLEGGILWNGIDPDSGFNGPVTFNDRDEEFQVNQFYLVFEKALKKGCCWSIGGRVDVLYGTDARFAKAAGWEQHPDGTDRWNSDGQEYQLAIPQAYAEIGHGNMSLKLGHFYTIIGYEVVPAPENFFYTHAYTMQYGEPFTHFGGLLSWDVGCWTLSAGLVNGWDAVDRVDDEAAFLGGVSYTPCHKCWSLSAAVISGEEADGIGGNSNRTMYSVVFDWNISNRLEYVLQHDYAVQNDYTVGEDATWYGINQYLFYTINCCWKAGVRFEWFRDTDGVRVAGIDPGNPYPGGSVGDFYEISAGLNWTPCQNIVVRPECRWDWFDGTGNSPYDDGNRNNQFLVGFDAIWTF